MNKDIKSFKEEEGIIIDVEAINALKRSKNQLLK